MVESTGGGSRAGKGKGVTNQKSWLVSSQIWSGTSNLVEKKTKKSTRGELRVGEGKAAMKLGKGGASQGGGKWSGNGKKKQFPAQTKR